MDTSTSGRLARLGNCVAALKGGRRADERARWPREQLLAYQQDQLGALVAHATKNSAFYRDLYGGVLDPGSVRLSDVPSVTKADWVASFDDVVTDPRLRIDEVEAHLDRVRDDELHLGAYRVMASSGSTGRRGVYVWGTDDWHRMLGFVMRDTRARGEQPSIPRLRLAVVAAPDARHMSARATRSLDAGIHRVLSLNAAAPLDELAAALQRYQPHKVMGYPSVISLLASEQLAGRLEIAPRWVVTTGEMLTSDMAARIRDAWGVETTNNYASTEAGLMAASCPEEGNLHLAEDGCIVEPVDDEGQPAPLGEPGTRVLLTSLLNRTQPVIRLEMSDEVALSPEPCPCGRTLGVISELRGRSDDILEFTGAAGTTTVHPIKVHAVFTSVPEVVSYQLVKRPQELEVVIVPSGPVDGLPTRLTETLTATLGELGVRDFPIRVRVTDHIPREPGPAKFKLVKNETAPSTI
ncbi:hypothetical protein N802_10450 [Knoellia sinensis KCTC 19936]|uniref:Coenzyme F390 synthetase n=1 Tax=Knoellia sinensis KCTC 19936 TaxID=1385520 RepID=A0A0A0IZC4_9MICO|nr:phenylacetate--CoA ligase family protein [Knoellia sinensis]KGN29839.1 hypothetical protein N802_10450 [Knoellia sinensis KCTC 19936]